MRNLYPKKSKKKRRTIFVNRIETALVAVLDDFMSGSAVQRGVHSYKPVRIREIAEQIADDLQPVANEILRNASTNRVDSYTPAQMLAYLQAEADSEAPPPK